MKKHINLLIFLLIAISAVIMFFKNRPPEHQEPSPKAPTVGIWPFSNPQEPPVTIAPHLTTKNYYIVFDGSASMLESECAEKSIKVEVAKKAVADFSKSLPKDSNLGLLVFDARGISERLPLGTENRESFVGQIDSVIPDGSTPLKTAIAQGVEKLTAQGKRQLGYGEYHLVVVTDGEAHPSRENPSAAVTNTLETSPIVIHTIGFCIGENHSLNQKGKTLYHSANSPEELTQGLREVLAESEQFDVKAFQ